MNPWQLFWAPQFHFPFGGSVAQRIEPNTNWFFGSIRPNAGDAEIEQKAFEVASYGKQLGLITELLLDLVDSPRGLSEDGMVAAGRLREIKNEIDKLKTQDIDALVADVESKMSRIQAKSKSKATELSKRINAKVNEPDA